MSFLQYLDEHRSKVDQALLDFLPKSLGPTMDPFLEVMEYPLVAGGKRIRPILVLAVCDCFGGNQKDALAAAVAVEYLHTYSLIHDDLPAMDDDDLRRGRPTTHKAYGEAQAILCGDALHTLAFECLSRYPEGSEWAAIRAQACSILAHASGPAGMVGGQVLDLAWEGKSCDGGTLKEIHSKKTGALLAASMELGALFAKASEENRKRIVLVGNHLGQLFQIVDDILDVTATTEDLGKTAGKDEQAGKVTYPSLFGLDGARKMAQEEARHANNLLEKYGSKSIRLRQMVDFVLTRKN